jgi:1-acyl-sn-glycerol-3-phosphate acyltransferase
VDLVYWPVIGVARTMFAAQGLRFTITGSEHIPRRGGAVMVINHTGYLDFTYAGLAAVPVRRLVRFMAKESVFSHRVTGPLMKGMRHIPVDRAAGAASYRRAVADLRAGEIVGVYPEATISRSFELKEFKLGAARMSQEAGVPILPTVIWGAQRVWTKDHPRRLGRTNTPILIDVAEPMRAEPDESATDFTARVRAVMAQRLEGLWAAYPPLTGDDLVFVPARLGGRAPTPEQAAVLDDEERTRRAAAAAAAARTRASGTSDGTPERRSDSIGPEHS